MVFLTIVAAGTAQPPTYFAMLVDTIFFLLLFLAAWKPACYVLLPLYSFGLQYILYMGRHTVTNKRKFFDYCTLLNDCRFGLLYFLSFLIVYIQFQPTDQIPSILRVCVLVHLVYQMIFSANLRRILDK